MSAQMYYLETGSLDPAYNLAFEEVVLRRRTRGDYLLLWQNDNTVVVGQNQNAEAEIDRAFVEAHDIRVVRRTTGGGAVYHDLGNLNYSFITDSGEVQLLALERFTRPVVEALRGLGLQSEASGRNDILVEGRKVSGTASGSWEAESCTMGRCSLTPTPIWWPGPSRQTWLNFSPRAPNLSAAGWAISAPF